MIGVNEMEEDFVHALCDKLADFCIANDIKPEVLISAAATMMGGGCGFIMDKDDDKLSGVIVGGPNFLKHVLGLLDGDIEEERDDLGEAFSKLSNRTVH